MKIQKTWDKSLVHSRFQITARNITNVQFNVLWAKNHFLTFLVFFWGCCVAYILQLTFRKFIWKKNHFKDLFVDFFKIRIFPIIFRWQNIGTSEDEWQCLQYTFTCLNVLSTIPLFLKLETIKTRTIIFHILLLCCYLCLFTSRCWFTKLTDGVVSRGMKHDSGGTNNTLFAHSWLSICKRASHDVETTLFLNVKYNNS